jgi:hypothetical protein
MNQWPSLDEIGIDRQPSSVSAESDGASASRKYRDPRYPRPIERSYVSQVPDVFHLDDMLNKIKNLPEQKKLKMPFDTELPTYQFAKDSAVDVDKLPIGRNYKGQIFPMPVSTDPWASEDEIRRVNTLGLKDQVQAKSIPLKQPPSNKKAFTGNRKIDLMQPEYENESPTDILQKALALQQIQSMQDQGNQRVNFDPMKRIFDIQESRNAVATGQQAPLTNQDNSGNRLSPEEISALKNKEAIDRLSSTLGIISLGENVRYAKDKTEIDKAQLDLGERKYNLDVWSEKEKYKTSRYGTDVLAKVRMAEIANEAKNKLKDGSIGEKEYWDLISTMKKLNPEMDFKSLQGAGTSAGKAAKDAASNVETLERADKLTRKLVELFGPKK